MLIRLLLVVLLAIYSNPAATKPETDLVSALHLAQTYLAERKIPNGERYLTSIVWHEDRTHPEKSCWSIVWVPDEVTLDAQLVVWVFADGTIRHQDTWA